MGQRRSDDDEVATTSPAPLAAPPRDDKRSQPHRLLRFELICRCMVLVAATTTCLLGWYVSNSLTYKLIYEGGPFGEMLQIIMTACVAIGLIDVFVNDILPARFHLNFVKHKRHLGYMALGGLYLLQAYASVGPTIGVEDILPLGYLANASVTGWYVLILSVRGWHV